MSEGTPPILVVEDNPVTLKMMRVALESEGYRVLTATTGAQALDILREERPSLILQDLLLPDINGIELTARMRQLPTGHDVPIIALSGLVSELEEADALRAGFTDYIFKPVGVQQLLEIVAAHVPPLEGPAVAQPGTGLRVLLVDDDPTQRKLQKLRLEFAGFEIETAEDGVDGLERARARPPDAVVSDLLMPRMNGFDFCLALRNDPRLGHIPVVLTSATFAEVEQADRELARSVGASSIVVRTPTMAEVLAALLDVLKPDAPRVQATAPVDAVQRQSIDRLIRQLERQAAISATLARRSAISAAQVSIMSGAAEVLAARSDLSATLNEVLRRALDAGGVSAGAIYLLGGDGGLVLRSRLGFDEAPSQALSGLLAELGFPSRDPNQTQPKRLPVHHEPTPAENTLLERVGMQSLVAAPLVSAGEVQGALIMASASRALGDEWISATKAIGVQLAQAVALTRTLARLSESEQRYRGLFEGAPLGLYRAAPNGGIVDANPTLLEMLGYGSRSALLGSSTAHIFADERERRMWDQAIERSFEVRGFEMRARRADGTTIWVENTARSARDEEGALLYYEGALVDITERRRAEQALRAAQARLQQVVSASAAIIYVRRLNAGAPVTVWVSENIENVLGYTVTEALQPDWWRRNVHPDDEEAAALNDGQPGREPIAREYRLRARDGTYRWILDEQRALGRPGDGEVVGTWMDITRRKDLETQLAQMQKMEAVGNLAGGVAHDFNNLLTVITGLSDMLLADLGPEHSAYADIREISSAADRAAALTRQLLAFSRRQVLQPRLIDLNAVIENLRKMLQRLLPEDVELVVSLEPRLRAVHADPGQIEQVLINLVVNARDAMPRGGRLTIESSNLTVHDEAQHGEIDPRPGDYVEVTVSDTGMGIDEDTMQRIFEPFFTTKPQGKGTGLGLATVYGIVQQSGGSIVAHSQHGEGTTFRLRLPVAVAHADRLSPLATTRSERLPRGDETVLLVEDDAAVRNAARTVLQRLGYDVLAADGPMDAMRLLDVHDRHIHLLLTDVVMPGMSGPELAQHVTRARPDIRVLYTSGYAGDAISTHGVLVEGAEFIPKPFTPAALAAKVRALLDRPAA